MNKELQVKVEHAFLRQNIKGEWVFHFPKNDNEASTYAGCSIATIRDMLSTDNWFVSAFDGCDYILTRLTMP
jgi:hypothetical protein